MCKSLGKMVTTLIEHTLTYNTIITIDGKVGMELQSTVITLKISQTPKLNPSKIFL